ncbi:transmembrane emp24 domain-containing protein 5 [Aplysia californica]|uniref:Transmembrane emp24 domain-containing protein 5 n=1 Tax=Aplysia californica TaxID=6500 RepID=A0ABM0ZXP2_APLCA|nr:transmembrane emp24 domain-containing protein 5 [Aplysia californica]
MAMRALVYLLFSFTLWSVCFCSDFDLTVDIAPGKQECFWHPFPQSVDVEVDYQVIDGGDMDIDMLVAGPDNRIYQSDLRKTENVVRFKTTSAGDYKICFDNTFSRISNKIVYFEVFIEDGSDDDEFDGDDSKLTFEGEDIQGQLDMTMEDFMYTILHNINYNQNCGWFKTTSAGDYKICFDNTFSRISNKIVYFEVFIEDGSDDDEFDGDDSKLTFEGEDIQGQLDMTMEDFMGILERAKKNIERSVQVQTLIRIHEAKDRNTQESNFYRVNFFSCFQLAVMIAVALVQVITIRSLFYEKKPASGSSLKART